MMVGKRQLVVGGLLGGLGILAACGAQAADVATGFSDASILIGISSPQTGVLASAGQTARMTEACFENANNAGGVLMADGKKRKINVKMYDDGYDPAKTVENVRRLVERDGVAAITGVIGSGPNSAIVDYLNEKEVPMPFVYSSASKFGANLKKWPWTTALIPTFSTEAAVVAEYLKKEVSNATVAILMQNGDYGDDYVKAFEKSIEGTSIRILDKATYESLDPSVDSQVVQLARTKANVLILVTLPKQAVQAAKKADELGWAPIRVVATPAQSVRATVGPLGKDLAKGLVGASYLKDPGDPQWADNDDVKRYRQVAKLARNVEPGDFDALAGYFVCQAILWALEKSQPNRKSLIDATRTFKDVSLDMMLPGIKLNSSPSDPFPVESLYINKFDGERFAIQGEPYSLEGKTPIIAH
jgi:branched-chain amino acid transport system substrate-binding protein